tara:strand:- start:329 stop:670 length:342 start_codon:yes stop_codon:yes gene_type:complete
MTLCKQCNWYEADPDGDICDACLEARYFDDEDNLDPKEEDRNNPINKLLDLKVSEAPLPMIYDIAVQHRLGNYPLEDTTIDLILDMGTQLNPKFDKDKFMEELIGDVFAKEVK